MTQNVLGMGMTYLAIGLVASGRRATRRLESWAIHGLAGLAVGVGILEASDMGSVCGLIVLACIAWDALNDCGPFAKRLVRGLNRSLLVASFATLMAGPTLVCSFGPSVRVDEAGQDVQARVERWNWATQWSLPKKEATALLVPGLFGFRMDSPGGGEYWGGIGRNPELDDWLDGGRKGPQPVWLLAVRGRRELSWRTGGAGGALGGGTGAAQGRCPFHPSREEATLVLERARDSLSPPGFWPFCAVLSVGVRTALFFRNAEPGPLSGTAGFGGVHVIRLRPERLVAALSGAGRGGFPWFGIAAPNMVDRGRSV